MIYTSYFASPKLRNIECTKIGIVAIPPKWFTGVNLNSLAPSLELLYWYKDAIKSHNNLGEIYKYYTNDYISKLEQLNLTPIVEYFKTFSNDVVLLCYERPKEFCHRHLLATYLNVRYAMSIKEL